MVAVHAARAAQTALGAIPEIAAANVTMAGAEIDVVRPIDPVALQSRIDAVFEPLGLRVVELIVLRDRALPMA